MSSVLIIYDVSSMIYAGTRSKYKSDFFGDSDLKGLPIGGVKRVLEHAIRHIVDREDVLLVFDSPTDKKSIYSDYKSTRVPDPAIIVQQRMLYDICCKIHLPVLKEDTYEADDLIYSFVREHHSEYSYITIMSGDADLAANILNQNITVMGTASIYPTITSTNYSHVLKHDVPIPYNCILPYFYFFGKPSNNVKAVQLEHKPTECFTNFIEFCDANGISSEDRSLANVMYQWLLASFKSGYLQESDELVDRVAYVYPKVFTGESLSKPYVNQSTLDNKQLLFFIQMLNMHWIRRLCFPSEQSLNSLTRPMYDFILKYKNTFENGCFSVDIDSTPDLSFFANKTSAFDLEGGDTF